MRIAIGYPQLESPLGHAQGGQNRQFQYFVHGAYIFPVIPATAATLLKQAGHEVYWSDGEAEEISWATQVAELIAFNPNLIAWEAKTPSVIGTWERIKQIKEAIPKCRVVLMGDHATALPEESLKKCPVDLVLTGGDMDFGLEEIVAKWGTHSQMRGVVAKDTQSDLARSPIIDRQLCKWWLYGYSKGSGNYKYLPGTHMMAGRDCWWRHEGGCTFCSWTSIFKNWRVRSVDQVMAELESCASLGIREVFDDTGTFPVGGWLADFCQALTKFQGVGGHRRITVGCNMRPGALDGRQYRDMAAAGFRFILYGLESANHHTLQRINKGQHEEDMVHTATLAKRAGLAPHVTCMVGYPWESRDDAARTIALTRRLFTQGLIDTLQATIIIPYPGTELFRQAERHGWLKYGHDWSAYDMRRPVMHCPMTDREVLSMTRGIYRSCLTPRYLVRRVASLRSLDDLQHAWRGVRYFFGHLADFKGTR